MKTHNNPYKLPNRIDLSTVKGKTIELDSKNRWYNRLCYKFIEYDLHVDGQLSAHPRMAYATEIESRNNAPYLIGFEIEIEHANKNQTLLANVLANALNTYIPGAHYVCNDGSLQNGFEIVTAPRTVTEIRQSYHLYFGLLKRLSKSGYTAHDNNRCGLHVHVSRKAMSDTKWRKLALFLSRNKDVFEKLSRRTTYNYCQFGLNMHDKYRALNFCPSNTREFRFFRGTLNPASFFASIEIVNSLVDFFRDENRKQFTLKQYVKWLSASSQFKYASTYIKDMCPVLEFVPAARRTAEEIAERKRLREVRRQARLNELQNELDRLIQRCTRELPAIAIGNRSLLANNQAIVQRNIPVILSSNFRQELYRYAAQVPPRASIMHVPDSFTMEQRERMHMYIGRSRGYGTDRTYAQLRFN